MVNKKVSGQTIAIIILAILLLIAIAFGGVYAFYSARSKKMTGTVVMANLNIELVADEYKDESTKSEIVISHGTNFVPGQELKNTALNIINSSAKNTKIYFIVVYEIKATKMNEEGEIIPGEIVEDKMYNPLIDLGAPYINPEENITYSGTNANWIDYVFTHTNGSETKQYRCLVSTSTWERTTDSQQVIPVIEENQLKLHKYMTDDYQRTSLAFAFQAYAIGVGEGSELDFDESVSQADRCNTIVSAIYESVEYKFFEGTVNQQGQ